MRNTDNNNMYTIKVNFEEANKDSVVITSAGDNTLLEAVLLNDIHLNHNCGGVCACTTCHIYVEQGDEYLAELSDREEDYIDRATNPRLNSRLACQCLLTDEEYNGQLEITIPDQSDIIGHEH